MSGERGIMTGREGAPAISVVIPCFNLGEYLDEAVDSVLRQTRRDFEIIVVDPGSTDESTRRLLAEYRRPGTRVLATERRRAGGARNFGIARARGRYILCLDADDVLEPDCLEKTSRVLDDDPSVGLVTFWYTIFGRSEGRVFHGSVSHADFLAENCACTASLFRREAWERAGGYDEELEGYEDWDFWLGILEHGYRAHLLREYLFRYRDRAGGKHHSSDSDERRTAIVARIIARHEKSLRALAPEVIARKDALRCEYQRLWQDAEERRVEAERRAGELERARLALQDELRRQTAELRRAIEGREHELRALRASKAWRLGSAVQRAWRLPFRIFGAPAPARDGGDPCRR